MSRISEQRVQHALSQLLERLIPSYADEDGATADERFDNAFNYAVDALERSVWPLLEVVRMC